MDTRTLLQGWPERPAALPLSVLRLAAAVPDARAALAPHLADPLARAACGLDDPPPWQDEPDLLRAAQGALLDAEQGAADPRDLARLEARAEGDPLAWVPAARAHVIGSEDRLRAARRRLSQQDLPFVMPGELHPLHVEVLAAGDVVLPPLHVDHVRKLTTWVADVLVVDARALGLWFWPVLRALDQGRLARALPRVLDARKLPAGARGLIGAYQYRIGGSWAPALEGAAALDRHLLGLAIAGDQQEAAPG